MAHKVIVTPGPGVSLNPEVISQVTSVGSTDNRVMSQVTSVECSDPGVVPHMTTIRPGQSDPEVSLSQGVITQVTPAGVSYPEVISHMNPVRPADQRVTPQVKIIRPFNPTVIQSWIRPTGPRVIPQTTVGPSHPVVTSHRTQNDPSPPNVLPVTSVPTYTPGVAPNVTSATSSKQPVTQTMVKDVVSEVEDPLISELQAKNDKLTQENNALQVCLVCIFIAPSRRNTSELFYSYNTEWSQNSNSVTK